MKKALPENIVVPECFQVYPCPSAGGIAAGSIEIDLGEWLIDGEKERVHLRIGGKELPKLVEALRHARGHQKYFAYGAFDVFVAARPRSDLNGAK